MLPWRKGAARDGPDAGTLFFIGKAFEPWKENRGCYARPRSCDAGSAACAMAGSDAAASRLASATRVADPPCGQLLARDILRMIGGAIDGCA